MLSPLIFFNYFKNVRTWQCLQNDAIHRFIHIQIQYICKNSQILSFTNITVVHLTYIYILTHRSYSFNSCNVNCIFVLYFFTFIKQNIFILVCKLFLNGPYGFVICRISFNLPVLFWTLVTNNFAKVLNPTNGARCQQF